MATVSSTPSLEREATGVMARVGYASRGLIYLLIGGFALIAAFHSQQKPQGFTGALQVIGHHPLGEAFVAALAVGLACFAGWLGISGIAQARREQGGRRWLYGAAMLADAAFYAGFMVLVLGVLLGKHGGGGGGGGGSEDQQMQAWTAWVFALPAGRWLVGITGVAIAIGGISMGVWTWTTDIESGVALGPRGKQLTEPVSRYGLTGRAAALALVGGYLVAAAIDANPSEAHGLGGVLQDLRHSHFGWAVLPVFASAFAASAFFDFLEAACHRGSSSSSGDDRDARGRQTR